MMGISLWISGKKIDKQSIDSVTKQELQESCLDALKDILNYEEYGEEYIPILLQNFDEIRSDYVVVIGVNDGFFISRNGEPGELIPWIYEFSDGYVSFLDYDMTDIYFSDGTHSCGGREDIFNDLQICNKLDGLDFFRSEESFKEFKHNAMNDQIERELQLFLSDPSIEIDWQDMISNHRYVAAFIPDNRKNTIVAASLQTSIPPDVREIIYNEHYE